MNLGELSAPRGARKRRRIVGRGESSGRGKTSGRGSNGQRSRTGRGPVLGFEGGQNPLIRRIPKRGFRPRRKTEYQLVNVYRLKELKEAPVVDHAALLKAGLIKDKRQPVKILRGKDISDKNSRGESWPSLVKADAFSKPARALIEKAGGTVECSKG